MSKTKFESKITITIPIQLNKLSFMEGFRLVHAGPMYILIDTIENEVLDCVTYVEGTFEPVTLASDTLVFPATLLITEP